jgi:hypothetical protein
VGASGEGVSVGADGAVAEGVAACWVAAGVGVEDDVAVAEGVGDGGLAVAVDEGVAERGG